MDKKEGWGAYRRKRKRQEGGGGGSEEEEGAPAEKKALNGHGDSSTTNGTGSNGVDAPPPPPPPSLLGGAHRAGFDAFMTGFIFAAHLASKDKDTTGDFLPDSLGTSEVANRIYLACKDFPLFLRRSAFAKNSQSHHTKYQRLLSTETRT